MHCGVVYLFTYYIITTTYFVLSMVPRNGMVFIFLFFTFRIYYVFTFFFFIKRCEILDYKHYMVIRASILSHISN